MVWSVQENLNFAVEEPSSFPTINTPGPALNYCYLADNVPECIIFKPISRIMVHISMTFAFNGPIHIKPSLVLRMKPMT